MTLVAPPTSQRAIPRKSLLFTMPWAGAITYKGKLYAIGYPLTGIDTMAYLNVWDDPTHLEMYRNIPLVNQGKIFGATLDTINQAIYVGGYWLNSPRTGRFWKWDLRTEQLSVVVNDVVLGIGSPQAGTQSGCCTDGTYLYAVYYTQSSVPSWLFKFRLSDGSLVTKIQMPSTLPIGGNAWGATRVEMFDSTTLIVHGLGNGWIASVPTDLSTVTNIIQPNNAGSLFGIAIANGKAWIGDYSEPILYVVNDAGLTSVTTYDYTAQAGAGNGFFDIRYDGYEWVWGVMEDYTILGIDTGANPLSNDPGVCEHVLREMVTEAPPDPSKNGWQPGPLWPLNENEPLIAGGGIAFSDLLIQATAVSSGYFVQYGTAPSQPRVVGRGVSGRR